MPNPKKEKPAIEQTTEETMERIFGKEITEAAKLVAHEKDNVPKKPRSSQK